MPVPLCYTVRRMFKFLHAADLHLDSPLQGLDRYDGAPVGRIRGATREAMINLVDLAVAERVRFVLIAGDFFDGAWRDYNTGLFFNAQMNRLGDAGIPVLLISGNHDAESEVTKSLTLPPHVRRLPVDRPATHVFDDLGVAVHGQGFATRAVLSNLAVAYPPAIGGLLNLGLLHTSATVADGHERYAPLRPDRPPRQGVRVLGVGPHPQAAAPAGRRGTTRGWSFPATSRAATSARPAARGRRW